MFIRGTNPIWLVADLTGHLVDDSYWMFVLENEIPYIPASVYHDPDTMATPWTNPINFLANGTLPVDIYWDPGTSSDPKTYRIEIRRGNTQSAPLIYLIENYVPGEGGGEINPTDIGFTTDNQITNPQFSIVNFVSPFSLTATVATDIQIGPGWVLSLTTSGTGTVVLSQVPLNSAALTKNPSNAPYALRLTLSGWTDVKLKQRFTQNGMLWANQFVSSNITARSDDANALISARLVSSLGTVLGTVLHNTSVGGLFTEYSDGDQLDDTINTNIPPSAWIEYQLQLQNNVDIYITSIQLIVSNFAIKPVYEQDSIERQIDHTFHYYEPQLAFKPIPSILTAWDFTLNPNQINGTPINSTPKYLWDQTIAQSIKGNLVATKNSAFKGLSIVNASANESFFLMQYLTSPKSVETIISQLSVNINGFSVANSVTATVQLFVTKNSGTIPILPTLIGNLNDGTSTGNAEFTLTDTTGWQEIPLTPGYDQSKELSDTEDTYFIGFDGSAFFSSLNTAPSFCIVVSFFVPTINTVMYFNSISLVPGEIPTRPAPQTTDEVIRECFYYYEKSAIGTFASTANSLFLNQAATFSIPGNGMSVYASPFTIDYKVNKRTTPTVVLYSTTTGAGGMVRAFAYYSNAGVFQSKDADRAIASFWDSNIGTSYTSYSPNTVNVLISQGPPATLNYAAGGIKFHYEVDARLGVV